MKRNLTMVYVGLRIRDEDEVAQCFLHAGREYFWKGIKYVVLGGKFIAVQDGERMTMARKQTPVGHLKEDEPSSEEREKWFDLDAAAREKLRQRREVSRARKLADRHWDALRPLHLRCQKLGYYEKFAFSQYVARLVISGKKGKP